ncbi:MAG: carboxypeptidase regulatory-like domain-containing protein [Acidobacteria bacterium]|nr:carboxypeptidase regulatory-like domain-containing protein [Acidobacteriota bacterium]
MHTFARLILGAACLALWPAIASAQTSSIAGTVKDASGAVLPGVTVEASSPALIEKVRSVITDGAGQYKIITLRPGTYTVTFTLPGFTVVKRANVELTSDFTATINADLRVGAVEETITVSAESPVVDTQSITTRTVMTRDVMDTIPTGRNIQAIGIMIPGTSIAVGGGGTISRDVGGSGQLQQSPLIYKGSGDSVQTIEGMRLNNLEGSGQYSGVYWNEASFEEFSYVTGADSAEMGQGGIRINMIPKDGGNTFRGSSYGNFTKNAWQSNNLRSNLAGDLQYNPGNSLTNVGTVDKIWDFSTSVGGPIARDKAWFTFTYRNFGSNQTVADAYVNANPPSVPGVFAKYVPDKTQPGVNDGYIWSLAPRVTWQATAKDKFSTYLDADKKYRPHWGLSGTQPDPEASGYEVTLDSFVSVTKWTRTQSNRLLYDAGLAVYNQEYTEIYQPSVTGSDVFEWNPELIRKSKVYTFVDSATGLTTNAWSSPADHFSKLFTESASVSYVTGSHSMKFGAAVTQGRRRTLAQWTGDISALTFNGGVSTSVTERIASEARESIKADTGIFGQDRWTIKRATINAGVRLDWYIGETGEGDLLAGRFYAGKHFGVCADGVNNPADGCVGRVQSWKDISPRLGISYDVFGNGKTAVKTSIARYVNGDVNTTTGQNNPVGTVPTQSTYNWNDLDRNNSIFNADGSVQSNELTAGAATNANFGKGVVTTVQDPATLVGWAVRPNNWEYAASLQHELMPRVSVNGGYYRRWYGNQTTLQNRALSVDGSSFDGPFCINTPSDARVPGSGTQLCGLYDLKAAFVGRVDNFRTFADNFGSGISTVIQGFDISTVARFSRGTYFQAGINAQKIDTDSCSAPAVGTLLVVGGGAVSQVGNPEKIFCKQTFPYRPDVKLVGYTTIPYDVQISGTYQLTQGPNLLAQWTATRDQLTAAGSTLGRALVSTSKPINIIEPGSIYGDYLNQLDLRASRRFKMNRGTFRVDADLYNVFNSNWVFRVNNAFSQAATSQWLRPTDVLQGRFFKIGGQFTF